LFSRIESSDAVCGGAKKQCNIYQKKRLHLRKGKKSGGKNIKKGIETSSY